jgi:hypothetical protein
MSGAWKSLAGVLLAAAVLYGMQRTMPYYGEITSPIVVEGKAGERVDAKAFALGIAKVHLARTIKTESYAGEKTYTTSGVWAVVEGAAEAKNETVTLMFAAWLGPNGVRYDLSQRLSNLPGILPGERFEPGLPKPVLMAFEVPETQAFDGTLIIARSAWTPLDEEVRVELPGGSPDDIRTAITVRRGRGGVPWTLEVE